MKKPTISRRRRTVLTFESLDERVTPSAGGLDPTFGTGGIVTTPIGAGTDEARTMVIDRFGRFVVAGRSFNGANWDFALARYNANGSLDNSFGSGGTLTTPIGTGDDDIFQVVVDGSDRIVVGGRTVVSGHYDFALARFNDDGSLDSSFGSGGKVITAVTGGSNLINEIALDNSGHIVAAGQSHNGTKFEFTVARYESNGSLDLSFGTGGVAITDIGVRDNGANSVAIDGSGRIVLGGWNYDGDWADFALARYLPNGSLDPSFGSGGKVTTPIGAGTDSIQNQSLAIDSNGRIVASGYALSGSGWDFGLARYSPDGQLDPSFGSFGTVTTAIGPGNDLAESLVLDEAGRMLVGGSSVSGGRQNFALARYEADGSLDASFGSNGRVSLAVGAGDAGIGCLALDGDGRIVAVGSTSNGTDFDFTVARFVPESFTTLTGPQVLNYTEDDPQLTVDNTLAFANSPNANLVGATVQIGSYIRTEDVLGYTLQGGITANFDSVNGLLTLSGSASVADYEAVLRSLTYSNTSQSPLELDRTLTVTVDDGEASQNLATATYTIHVFARNDAPTLSADGFLAPIQQQNVVLPGQKIAAIFDKLDTDPDAGDFLNGLAIVGNSANAGTEGVWQYSTDNGTSWFDVGPVADDATALALSAQTRLRFVPIPTFTGQPTPLIVRAIDSTFAGAFTSGALRQTVDVTSNGGTTPIAASINLLETQVFAYGSGNVPPTLVGVPVSVSINEGDTLSFTASSTDPDLGQSLTFSLDSASVTASIDPDTGAFSWTTTEADGPNTFIFNVQVTDGFTVTEKTVTVIVREVNLAPVLANVPATVTLAPGSTVAFTATASDTDLINGNPNALTFSLVGAPVGATIDPDTGLFSWTPGDSDTPGDYTFNVRVVDDGVPALNDSQSITVTVAQAVIVDGDLLIGGTGRNDVIAVNLSKDKTQLIVVLNRKPIGTFALSDVTGRIIVHGLSGNDRITVSPKLNIPADLYGDAGNDVLTGGAGDDRLFGNAGDDKLTGGLGNDLLVGGDGNDKLNDAGGTNVLLGGAGVDRLAGGKGDDLLIAGPTDFDNDLLALNDIVAEWTSSSTYEDRISHLTGTAGGNNGTTFLSNATVHDDGVKDVLIGAKGRDYFVVSNLDKLDLKSDEQKLEV